MKKVLKMYKTFKNPEDVELWVKKCYDDQSLSEVSVLPYDPSKRALNLYKGLGYKGINSLLRKNKSDEVVEELMQLIGKFEIPENIVVTRFVDFNEWWNLIKETMWRKVYKYKGFLSTTLLRKHYAMDDIRWCRIPIQIYVPKGTKGVYLPEVNPNAREYEILITPGQKLQKMSWNKYQIIM